MPVPPSIDENWMQPQVPEHESSAADTELELLRDRITRVSSQSSSNVLVVVDPAKTRAMNTLMKAELEQLHLVNSAVGVVSISLD